MQCNVDYLKRIFLIKTSDTSSEPVASGSTLINIHPEKSYESDSGAEYEIRSSHESVSLWILKRGDTET